MNQVKQAMAVLGKYKFWIACGLLTLLPIGVWFVCKSEIDKRTEARRSTIESSITTAKNIAGIQNHPNPVSHEGLDKNVEQTKQSVLAAWKQQYDKQKEILVWPNGTDELRQDTCDAFSRYHPIEANIEHPTPPTEEVRIEFREDYRDYIKAELPKLAEKIGAKWTAIRTPGGGGGAVTGYESSYGGMDMGSMYGNMYGGNEYGSNMYGASGMIGGQQEDDFIVTWDSADQGRLRDRFDWSGNRDKVPMTIDVLYAQEDLWVLNALMNIIRETNRDATASYNATIKQLNYIQLGRAVTPAAGKVQRLTASAVGGYGGSEYGEYMTETADDYGSDYDSMMQSGEEGTAGLTAAVVTGPDPADRRYVDNNYEPVPATDVREALSPDNKDPEKAFLVVAKRIPIRLGLTMDQRRIPRLIAACGNSNLMVEVRQVRVNKKSSGTGGYGVPSAGGMGGGLGFGGYESGMGSGYEDMSSMMGGSDYGAGGYDDMSTDYGGMGEYGMGGMGGSVASRKKSSYDLPVEVYGIVYIYNPVDMAKLGIEQKVAEPGTESDPAVEEPVDGQISEASDGDDSTAAE